MDAIFKCLSTEIKVDIDIHDIDNMHRLGKPKSSSEKSSTGQSTSSNKQLNSRPRDIIIKFTLYRARQVVFTHRSQLKHSKILERVFINEELTETRGEVYDHARRLVKIKRVHSVWTSNDIILIKDNSEKVHRCESMGELSKCNKQT
ncbi:uncharacterized protein LOC128221495 [Mya arenaria]|uniref:uncharacterized protein LOC128221495 n=1 Tax=Mya arenaria TaxID=6604 RepID=UPI0022E1E422|nr:uncharacterized protein LOC128221495 [Mya arenaria]